MLLSQAELTFAMAFFMDFQTEMTKLQRVQHAAARLLTSSRNYDLIKYRIHFKILLLTLKELNDMAPAYISDLM